MRPTASLPTLLSTLRRKHDRSQTAQAELDRLPRIWFGDLERVLDGYFADEHIPAGVTPDSVLAVSRFLSSVHRGTSISSLSTLGKAGLAINCTSKTGLLKLAVEREDITIQKLALRALSNSGCVTTDDLPQLLKLMDHPKVQIRHHVARIAYGHSSDHSVCNTLESAIRANLAELPYWLRPIAQVGLGEFRLGQLQEKLLRYELFDKEVVREFGAKWRIQFVRKRWQSLCENTTNVDSDFALSQTIQAIRVYSRKVLEFSDEDLILALVGLIECD